MKEVTNKITNIEIHDHSHGLNRFAVIPTADRLKVDPRFTGRGVTIAFLDSGFYQHPDLRGNRFLAGRVRQHAGPRQERRAGAVERHGR